MLALAAISAVPQVLGSLVHFAPFEDSLLGTGLPLYDPATFWQWRFSPLVGQWRYISTSSLDFAWARAANGAARVDWPVLAALSIALVLSATALAGAWQRRGRLLLPSAGVVLVLAASFMLVRSQGPGQLPLDTALRLIQRGERPGDALLTARTGDSPLVSDRYKGRLPAYGLPLPSGLPSVDGPAPRLARYQRLWLLRDNTPLERSADELWLAGWGYQMQQATGGDWRLVLYARPQGELPITIGRRDFEGGVSLVNAAAAQERDTLFVRLRWQTGTFQSRSYKVFLHVYDAQGNLIAQGDSVPALWQRPATSWQPGETVEDRHGLLLPAGEQAAVIRLGLYDPETGERLATTGGEDQVELPLR
jgi:hypothetical protein